MQILPTDFVLDETHEIYTTKIAERYIIHLEPIARYMNSQQWENMPLNELILRLPPTITGPNQAHHCLPIAAFNFPVAIPSTNSLLFEIFTSPATSVISSSHSKSFSTVSSLLAPFGLM